MITMQAPEKQRTLLVAPQRDAQRLPGPGAWPTRSATADSRPLGRDRRLRHRGQGRARRTAPTTRCRPPARTPARCASRNCPPRRSGRSSRRRATSTTSSVILTRKDRVTVPFGNAVLRSMSTGWRGDRAAPRDFRDAIGGYLTDLIDAVHILDKTTLTLSGRSGTIPVTVKNELGQPVTGLVLRLTSSCQHPAGDQEPRAADRHRRRPHPYPEVPDHGERQRHGRDQGAALHPERRAVRRHHPLRGPHHQGHRPGDADHRRRTAAAGARGRADLPSAQAKHDAPTEGDDGTRKAATRPDALPDPEQPGDPAR